MTAPTAQDEVVGLLSDLIRINTSNPTHPGASGGGVGRRESRRGRGRVADHRGGEGTCVHDRPPRGHRLVTSAAADPLPPRCRARRRVGVDCRPVLRRGQGRLRLGTRRGRHEGHGRDGAGARPPVAARRVEAAARHRPRVRLRRGGGRPPGRALPRRQPPPTCSPTAPRRSARSAASASRLNEQARIYTVQTAEKGINWLRLRADGSPGHGSMIHDDNAVTRLAEAVARVGNHQWPVVDHRHRPRDRRGARQHHRT